MSADISVGWARRHALNYCTYAAPVPASRQSCLVSSRDMQSDSMLPTKVTTAELARLRNVPELAERKIIVPGSRKGTYALEPSVRGYAKHLRRLAQGRHGTEDASASATVERAKLAE